MKDSTRRELSQPGLNPEVDPREWRAAELLAGIPEAVLCLSANSFRVRSESGSGYYRVERTAKGWTCECPDFADRGRACKHVYAVIAFDRRTPATVPAGTPYVPRTLTPRDHKSSDEAQQAEHLEFDSILGCLLGGIPNPAPIPGARGRPPLPLRLQYHVSIRKVHLCESL
jgi:SWIM zinc finger